MKQTTTVYILMLSRIIRFNDMGC